VSTSAAPVPTNPDERGSTIPLVLGFFLIALVLIAAGVAAGDAFVQQRGLQDVCDGAAAAAASTAIDLTRGSGFGTSGALSFADVQRSAGQYLARDPSRAQVVVRAALSDDATTLTLTCTETTKIAFGAMFGKGDGVHHLAVSSARAPVSA
jgi:Flp pilus assembly protein TadG